MEDIISFGSWLKQRRRAMRLSQEALASLVYCSSVLIRKIEADARRPSPELAELLARHLGLAPHQRATFVKVARAELQADWLPAPTEVAALLVQSRPAPVTGLLPVPTTPLIGRAQEVMALSACLLRPEVRLLTLVGAPGIGKTRLGLQVAADIRGAFADDVCFVALAQIRDSDLVLDTIARALGVEETARHVLSDRLQLYLRNKQILLLLDNVEQVVEAAPRIAELLAAAPHLKVLATSRAALHLTGEHRFPVPPLALPDHNQVPALETLTQAAAVALFVQRAQAVAPDFVLTSANAMAVVAICQRLDGLPLAIELAAAWSQLLTPPALLARLDLRLVLLTDNVLDVPKHQQTLRSTIDWSYELLNQRDSRLFAQLGVFARGCTLEAATAVCSDATTGEVDILNGLISLLDKSLLQRTAQNGSEWRLGMLETIREYALERLEEHGEAEALRQRHAAYYLTLVEGVEAQFQQTNQSMWLDRLKVEHDNLRAILMWANTTARGAEIGLRLVTALAPFWEVHGHLSEGRAWLTVFLAHAEKPFAETATRAKALFGLGILAREQNDYSAARAAFEESAMIARGQGDTRNMMRSLLGLGRVTADQGDYEAARTHIAECLATCRALGDRAGIASAMLDLGMIAWWQGDYAAVRAAYEEVLEIADHRQDEIGLTYAFNKLGDVARVEGDYAQAMMHYQAGLTLTRKLENKFGVLWSLHNLGELARDQGDYGRAAALYEESLAIGRELEYTSGIASLLNRQGEIAQAQGDYERAGALHCASLVVFQDLAQKRDILLCLEGLAMVAEAQEHSERSAVLYGAVATLREATGALLPPRDRANYARSVERVRVRLGKATFEAATGIGRTMPLDRAIAYALTIEAES